MDILLIYCLNVRFRRWRDKSVGVDSNDDESKQFVQQCRTFVLDFFVRNMPNFLVVNSDLCVRQQFLYFQRGHGLMQLQDNSRLDFAYI